MTLEPLEELSALPDGSPTIGHKDEGSGRSGALAET